ncbi:hypothetical protein ACH4FX_12315 [Streptomyces sp. NPDC018019]|uniref:hypothetical protein n=1 Tax=Streptomyces sp. NPDC018019 TaxID=3365030 RepID=UPI0037A15966
MSSLDAATWGYCPHCRREVETRRMRGVLRLIGHRTGAAFPSDCEGSHGPPGVPPGDEAGDWSWVSTEEREARVREVMPGPGGGGRHTADWYLASRSMGLRTAAPVRPPGSREP